MKKSFKKMKLVTHDNYVKFTKAHKEVVIENVKIKIGKKWNIRDYCPHPGYRPELETIWSFPERGSWATHSGDYRGNWSPYISRNLIERYTDKGDWVLDQMVGSGTTLVECKLLGRNGIGIDINSDAIMVARDRLNFHRPSAENYYEPQILTYIGDARNLDKIGPDTIDLIATHPPYANIISYSSNKVEGDISVFRKLEDYLLAIHDIAKESLRVLKPNKHCAILIGDTRHHKHYIPIAFRVLQEFLNIGFILRENIVKIQWKTKKTREKWRSSKLGFYRIAHEHLYIFRKPSENEKLKDYKYSIKWWI